MTSKLAVSLLNAILLLFPIAVSILKYRESKSKLLFLLRFWFIARFVAESVGFYFIIILGVKAPYIYHFYNLFEVIILVYIISEFKPVQLGKTLKSFFIPSYMLFLCFLHWKEYTSCNSSITWHLVFEGFVFFVSSILILKYSKDNSLTKNTQFIFSIAFLIYSFYLLVSGPLHGLILDAFGADYVSAKDNSLYFLKAAIVNSTTILFGIGVYRLPRKSII